VFSGGRLGAVGMDQMKRFAIYFAPRDGAFADAAARWLGWDLAQGRAVAQPDVVGLADLTADPRKYGFHGTIKPPFRLAEGVSAADLADGVAQLAQSLRVVQMPGLQMVMLEGFLALIPGMDADLSNLAAEVVRVLDRFRAPLTEAEIARRRPECLTQRQRDLLAVYGYPYVMEEFQFHLTLSGRLSAEDAPRLQTAATAHFAGLIPQPFAVEDLCLCGEDQAGRFHLLHRYALSD
jgi:putative phosphonate metabolism protein